MNLLSIIFLVFLVQTGNKTVTENKNEGKVEKKPEVTNSPEKNNNSKIPSRIEPDGKKTILNLIKNNTETGKSAREMPESIEVTGTLIDKKETVKRIISILLENNPGPPEKVLKKFLGQIGYSIRSMNYSQKVLRVDLFPVLITRNVFIKGNWPLFESDIMRRVILRPGTPLPTDLNARKELFELQRRRIEDYLHREGYFDSVIKIKIKEYPGKYNFDLYIHLDKGSSYKLGKIGVSGNSAVKKEKIVEFFRHKLFLYERPFYLQTFKKDIQKLQKYYRKLGYFSVSIRHDFDKSISLDRKKRRVNVNLIIRERRKVEVLLEGNRKIPKEELMDELSFVSSGTYDEYEINRSAENIRHAYQKKGFFHAAVHHKSYIIGNGRLRIIFYIMEGKQYRVGKITFSGQKHFKSQKLKSEIETKIFPKKLAYFGLGSGGFITPVQLNQDAKRIEKLYNLAGYPETKVKVEVRPLKNYKWPATFEAVESAAPSRHGHEYVSVDFDIQEGKRVLISKIKWNGLEKSLMEKLKKLTAVKEKSAFSMENITEDLKKIKIYLANMGYPHTVITTDIKAADDQKGVVIIYNIDRREKTVFGPIVIRGNFKTKSSVVWREIPFKEGDTYSIKVIEEAGRNLRSLGVFRSVRVQFLGFNNNIKKVPVYVSLIERYDDYGELELGGGFSTDNPYFASFTYRNRNVFGYAKSIEVKGEVGAEIQHGRITYLDPRFLNTKLNFEVTGYVRQEETVRLGDILTYGASVTLRKMWTPRFQWFLRYEIRHVSYKENLVRVSSAPDESSKVDFATTTASLGPTVIYDKRDNPLVPKKGYRLTSSVRMASRYLGGDDDFIHINTTGQLFIPIPFGLVIAQGIRYDHGIPLFSTNVLPKVERFFAGGDTTVRGYEEDRLFAQTTYAPLAPGGTVNLFKSSPLGGNIRFISNTELQFPIFKKSFLLGMPIWGALFFDTGYIINNYSGFESTIFHSGYGAALRLVSPVGVISLEYGIPMVRIPGTDPSGRVHFNFGFIF